MSHGYTNHGHPCCGEAKVGDRPPAVARCGGGRICSKCAVGAMRLHGTPDPAADIAVARAEGVREGRQWAIDALKAMADEIDRGPTFPVPPSVISALVRERAEALAKENT